MNKRSQSGFTLVEIMVVVVIVGLLSTMAIPAFAKVRESSRNSAFANDIRIFSNSIETFAMETGAYPGDPSTGTLPPELAEYISLSGWNGDTPLGGRWDIEGDDLTSSVGVVGFTIGVGELQRFDQRFDDGDLGSGKFRRVDNRYYFFIAE